MGGYIILAVIFTGLMYLSAKFCMKVFGEPKFIYELQKIAAAQSQAQVLNSLNTVSTEDKLAFSGWVLVFNFISSIFNYFVLLYVAAIEFSNSNIIKSFVQAVKLGFKNITGSIFILFFMFILYFMLNIISLALGTGAFGLFAIILLFCLYLNYYVILVMCFYNEKTKINSDNGAECIGEN